MFYAIDRVPPVFPAATIGDQRHGAGLQRPLLYELEYIDSRKPHEFRAGSAIEAQRAAAEKLGIPYPLTQAAFGEAGAKALRVKNGRQLFPKTGAN